MESTKSTISTKNIKNIIFSGGGFKCWAYIGTIRVLYEEILFKNIKSVIGVSCGSIFGLFYLLQFDYSFLLNHFLQLDIKKYIDIDIDSVITNQSLVEGKKFKQLIQECMSKKINPESTFQELFDKTGILFTTVAFNITDVKIDYFNKDLTPYVKVIDAIMASSALPMLFPAYTISYYKGNEFIDKLYYDGGICNNCPCNLVNEEETIAFDLSSHSTTTKYNIYSLVLCVTELLNKQFNNINKKITFNILDAKYENETVNLNQSNDDIFNVYMNGYNNTKKIFKKKINSF